MKHSIGDTVTIKHDLKLDVKQEIGKVLVTPMMMEYKGMTGIIVRINDKYNCYKLRNEDGAEIPFWWTDEMLEAERVSDSSVATMPKSDTVWKDEPQEEYGAINPLAMMLGLGSSVPAASKADIKKLLHKEGDVVMIREDLDEYVDYGRIGVNADMVEYRGKYFIVGKIILNKMFQQYCYRLRTKNGDYIPFFWTDRMLDANAGLHIDVNSGDITPLMNAINKALDSGNREEFNKLSKQYVFFKSEGFGFPKTKKR